jgi:hypothetical protein
MNRFSHSVDTPVASIDLMEILDLVRNLSGYLSFAGKMHIHPVDGDYVPIVLTCPFILQAIIYQAVVLAFRMPVRGRNWMYPFSPGTIRPGASFLTASVYQGL